MQSRSPEQRMQRWRRNILVSVLFCATMAAWWGIGAYLVTYSNAMVSFRDCGAAMLALGLLALGVLWFYKPQDE